MEASSSFIRRWKYLLILSAVFLSIYTMLHSRPPSVSLPSDLQLLQLRRLGLRRSTSPLTTASGMLVQRAVDVFPGGWMVDDDGNDEASAKDMELEAEEDDENKQEHASKKSENNKKILKQTLGETKVKSKVKSNDDDAIKLSEILDRREIIGNDRFFHRLGRGIQRPEEFYERHRDVRVWQQQSADISTKTTDLFISTTSAANINHSSRQASVVYSTSSQSNSVIPRDEPPNQNRDTIGGGDDKSVDRLSSSSSSDLHSTIARDLVSPQKVNVTTSSEYEPRKKKKKNKKKKTRQAYNGTTLASLMHKSYPPVIVESSRPFMDRIQSFNDAIERVRDELLRVRGYRVWQDVADPSQLNVIWGNEDDFLDRLAEQSRVTTVLLPWINGNRTEVGSDAGERSMWSNWTSLVDMSNVLINNYYEWAATEPLCEWIETSGFTRGHWDAVYNRICNEEVEKSAKPRSLEFFYLYGKPINVAHYWPNDGVSYPDYFYFRPPVYVFYVNLVQDAIINGVGDVITGDLKLVPYTCSHDNLPTIPAEYQDRPVYREVFIISQFWGASFFHKMLEVMPRIAAYVHFLRANTGVQIHAPEDRAQVSEMLRWLGINPERIVTGIVRAKLAYLPQGTPCGFPDARGLQLLSKLFRDYRTTSAAGERAARNRLLYVRRSGMRKFVHGPPIEYVLQTLAVRYHLNYTVFGDNPTPSLDVAADYFSSSVLVIGPHGAGLSNVVFCEPGTVVIEGVCNEPHVNMCYQFTSHILGLRYHAMPSSGGCERVVDVLPETVEETVERYLKMITHDVPETAS